MPDAHSFLNFVDATVIQARIEDLRQAEDALHRARTALDKALSGLIFQALTDRKG